jgi:hypothetical protein
VGQFKVVISLREMKFPLAEPEEYTFFGKLTHYQIVPVANMWNCGRYIATETEHVDSDNRRISLLLP